ncbi:SDR family oxidoreductase [Oryzifoliimicrobium ureilyticus]|uniref:SDR family oxidoreductase n=1 Tax=Oryzifoliimicrobium ureilyticus TaxID=3113724 RepID=UPI003076180D
MKASGNTILLTGGSSGIGRALAQRWHDAGNSVIITGRRRDMLAETAKGRPGIKICELDVADAATLDARLGEILASNPAINVLVNNAGVYSAENPRRRRDLKPAEQMVETNLLAPIRITNALIDHLSAQANAAIVNVSSGIGFVPYPAAPTYSATKAALHSYTAALRPLLKGKVEVIEIIPPQVQTELTPGQSQDPNSMPLYDFADEVMTLLHHEDDSSPAEICVERVRQFRDAERAGRFDEILDMMARYTPDH